MRMLCDELLLMVLVTYLSTRIYSAVCLSFVKLAISSVFIPHSVRFIMQMYGLLIKW